MASFLDEHMDKRGNWLPDLIESENAMQAWEGQTLREKVLRLYKFLNQLGYTAIGIDAVIECERTKNRPADSSSDVPIKARP
jgi:hypothetical protein